MGAGRDRIGRPFAGRRNRAGQRRRRRFRGGAGVLGSGLGVFVATLVHKPADALTITALMIEAGAPRRYTHVVNLAFALMIPVGVALFWIGTRGVLPISAGSWTATALAFSAGTFLCIRAQRPTSRVAIPFT